jgi:hypothetical protein
MVFIASGRVMRMWATPASMVTSKQFHCVSAAEMAA